MFLSVFGSRYRFCGVEKLTTLTWTFHCRDNTGVYRREGEFLRLLRVLSDVRKRLRGYDFYSLSTSGFFARRRHKGRFEHYLVLLRYCNLRRNCWYNALA